MWASGLQLGLAPAKQLGNRIDAIGDVPSVAQIELCLPADVTRPHLRLQTLPGLRREAFLRATSLRWRQQRRQAARAVALPLALNGSHTVAQHLRCLTDPGDPLFLEKTKQPQAIGSGLVTSRFLRGLQHAQYLPGSTAGKRWSYSASRPEHITHSDQSQHTRVDTHSDFASFLPMSYVSIHSNWYETGGFKGFARSLRQDRDAVQAALRLPWSTGPVEGQINRLKVIKRSMYGRAGFDLLRHRVLAAA